MHSSRCRLPQAADSNAVGANPALAQQRRFVLMTNNDVLL